MKRHGKEGQSNGFFWRISGAIDLFGVDDLGNMHDLQPQQRTTDHGAAIPTQPTDALSEQPTVSHQQTNSLSPDSQYGKDVSDHAAPTFATPALLVSCQA